VACPDENLLVDMVEQAADPELVKSLEVHLDSCDSCRDVVAALALGSKEPRAQAPGRAWVGVDHPELLEQETIADRYVLSTVLGRGGMGTVYLAKDLTLGREVALKLHHGGGNARLHREALAMAKLSHPNVVNVFDVGTVGDHVYVALEYVKGETLRGWLESTKRTWREVLAVLIDAGTGLAAAHAAGMVHRDFKPDNVLVGADRRARVSDFGLAHVGDLESSRPAPGDLAAEHAVTALAEGTPLTETGAVLGTPAYMSPEQVFGEGVDARSDQFAFCMVAWECLLGVRPFAGKTLAAIQASIAAQELVRPKTPVPDAVVKVLERGLVVDPEARYADMTALLAELRRAASPRRGRKIALAAAALAAVIGGGLVIAQTVRTERHEAACAAEGDKVRALLGDPAREKMHAAFLASKLPSAQSSFDRTFAVLQKGSAAIADRVTGVCRAGTSSPLAEARASCLAAKTSQLANLVTAMSAPNPALVKRSIDVAWAFYEARPCNDAVARHTTVIPPKVAEEIGRMKAIASSGKYKDAYAVGTALLATVTGTESELDVRLAMANSGQHLDPKEAAAELHRVLALAEASGRDLDAAIAFDQLAHVSGVSVHDYTAAHRFVDLARAKLARLGGDNLAIHGKVLATEGQILEDENRMGDAEKALRAAIAVFEDVFGPDHPNVGLVYGSLTQVLRYQSKDDEARGTVEKTLAILEGALGPEHPNAAGAMMTYAQMLTDRKEYAKARELLSKADAVFARVFGEQHPVRASALANIGAVEQALKNYEAALAAFTRALEIVEKAEGPGARNTSGARLDMARALAGLNRWAEAEDQVKKSIATLEGLGTDGEPWLPASLLTLAELYLERGQPQKAIAPSERALGMLEKRADDDAPSHLADARYDLARALWDSGGDKQRARQLAELARTHPGEESRREIEAWLARHVL